MAAISKRHSKIVQILEAEGTVSISDLAGKLSVSTETVRRDIRPLAAMGTIVRMHGAVGLAAHSGEAPFQRRMRENAEAKQAIARAAAGAVANGDSLMLDTGTTTSFLARALTGHERLDVVTNSTDIARTLSGRKGNRVYLLGGRVNGDSGAVLGVETVQAAARFRVDHAIISAGAVGVAGIMDYDPEEADFARTALKCGRNRMVIFDSAKYGREALTLVCGWEEVDRIVSERAPERAVEAALRAAKVAVTVAGPT